MIKKYLECLLKILLRVYDTHKVFIAYLLILSASRDDRPAMLDSPVGVIKPGSFFGEIGHLLSEDRSATIRAKTDVSVFVLPPRLFNTVLKYDTNLEKGIIAHMPQRLKNSNDRIAALSEPLQRRPI